MVFIGQKLEATIPILTARYGAIVAYLARSLPNCRNLPDLEARFNLPFSFPDIARSGVQKIQNHWIPQNLAKSANEM